MSDLGGSSAAIVTLGLLAAVGPKFSQEKMPPGAGRQKTIRKIVETPMVDKAAGAGDAGGGILNEKLADSAGCGIVRPADGISA